MGVYSLNRTTLSGIDESQIIADESYAGVTGCYQCMIDMEKNNHMIFESTIQSDFLEASYLLEGRDVTALNEARVSDIFDKIKAFLKKVWEKIKGIFQNFIKKLDTVIIRDNKELVKKYQKEVYAKNRTKMKYKWCDPTGNLDKLKDKISGDDLKKVATDVIARVSNNNRDDQFKKIKEKIEDNEYYDFIVSSAIPDVKTDYKDMEKDIHEYCFETEQSEEGLEAARLSSIIKVLMGDKTKSDVEKSQNQLNKYFKNIYNDLDKASTAVSKIKYDDKTENDPIDDVNYAHYGDDWDKEGSSSHKVKKLYNYTKKQAVETFPEKAGVAQQAITQIEAVHNKLVACFLKEHKFEITQARRVFSKAISYNPKKAKNEAMEMYLDAVAEAADYETELLFEAAL